MTANVVSDYRGMRVEVRSSNEHYPRHVHVYLGGEELAEYHFESGEFEHCDLPPAKKNEFIE